VSTQLSTAAFTAALDRQDRTFERAFSVLRQGIAERVFPGAAAAVNYRGTLVALKGIGSFTCDAGSPVVTAETIYDLASLTKVMATTTMAMLLYERGIVKLEQPVAESVPEFAGGNRRRRRVTLGMLLAHSSGLPAYARLFERAKNREELVLAACRAPLEAEPGTHAEYSDLGFIVLGEALARLALEPLDEFCRRKIFAPLGMSQTRFCPPAPWKQRIPPTVADRDFRRRRVQGEVHDENASVMHGVAGHAGLFAPAGDVARFAHAMLSGGHPILRPETLRRFTRRQPPGTRALGWDTPTAPSQSGRYFSPESFGHLGYTGTSLWIDPARQLAVTLLTNRTWPNVGASEEIKQVRPRFHDAVVEALEPGGDKPLFTTETQSHGEG